MATTVQRLPADKPGEAIVSAVLTSVEAQLERGRYEVNTEDKDRRTVSADIVECDFIQPGGLHTIDNKGFQKNGLLVNFDYSCEASTDSVSVTTTMKLETIA
jgi:hypothetical protein